MDSIPWSDLTADTVCKVIEYLNKKGYSRTEAMLRAESAHTDKEGRPIRAAAAAAVEEDKKPEKFIKGFGNFISASQRRAHLLTLSQR